MRYRRVTIPGAAYFFTVVTYRRNRMLAHASAVALLADVMADVQHRHPFDIEAQVVLPDHLHAMWRLPQGDSDFAVRWALIKSAFSRRFAKETELARPDATRISRREQTVWQRRFWEHLIRDQADFNAHLNYIHYNPVRHGLRKAPGDWPYSTFAL